MQADIKNPGQDCRTFAESSLFSNRLTRELAWQCVFGGGDGIGLITGMSGLITYTRDPSTIAGSV